MTSQTVINNSPANLPAATAVYDPTAVPSCEPRVFQAMKSQYQLDQQVKFLNLQAEMESLLQQLRTLKQQRQASEETVLVGQFNRPS